MGAPLLTLTALLLLAACAGPEASGADDDAAAGSMTAADLARPLGSRAGSGATAAVDAHARMTCSACHAGGRADYGRASVPRSSCTASGCHDDAGPAQVSIATVTFEHRSHGVEGDIVPSCAGCHTHDEGGAPLRASVDACALCHVDRLTGTESRDCQTCHQQPRHVTLTAEGVPVPHSTLPWTAVGCVRCHYDVADPPTAVETARCADCHQDVAAVTARGIGRDLHPSHDGLTCTACHDEGAHRVRAMSSAVSLVCADCHAEAHELTLSPRTDAGTCLACHGGIHAPQQELLLGVLPGERAMPSTKFLAGLTCRSCHSAPGAPVGETPLRGQAQACASCHREEYGRVLDWWLEGAERRQGEARAYLDRAKRDLAGARADTVVLLLASADAGLGLVEAAGGQHNLELADRMFRESVDRARRAYRLAGRAAPPPPDLGRAPHYGLCSGCHYATEPWDFRSMSSSFHREVMRLETP